MSLGYSTLIFNFYNPDTCALKQPVCVGVCSYCILHNDQLSMITTFTFFPATTTNVCMRFCVMLCKMTVNIKRYVLLLFMSFCEQNASLFYLVSSWKHIFCGNRSSSPLIIGDASLQRYKSKLSFYWAWMTGLKMRLCTIYLLQRGRWLILTRQTDRLSFLSDTLKVSSHPPDFFLRSSSLPFHSFLLQRK